jgi:TRAP-type mannitol/chloroaromatic compound transport system substrate-binding protein
MVNRTAWDSLPADLQAIVEISCQAINQDMVAEYTNGNAIALQQLMDDPDVELRRFPDEVLARLKEITDEVVAEWIAEDPKAAKVFKSFDAFRQRSIPFQRISERAFMETRR